MHSHPLLGAKLRYHQRMWIPNEFTVLCCIFFPLSRIIACAHLLVNFFTGRSPNCISNHVLSCQVPTSPHKIKRLKQVIVILWKRVIIFQVHLIFEYCCNDYNLHFKISKQPCACSPQDPGVFCQHRRQLALQSPFSAGSLRVGAAGLDQQLGAGEGWAPHWEVLVLWTTDLSLFLSYQRFTFTVREDILLYYCIKSRNVNTKY